VHTQTIEGFWSIFKRGIVGTSTMLVRNTIIFTLRSSNSGTIIALTMTFSERRLRAHEASPPSDCTGILGDIRIGFVGQSKNGPPQQTPDIKAEQQPNGGLKAEPNTEPDKQPATPTATAIPEVLSDGPNRKCRGDCPNAEQEGTEFWPPFYGYRLKVTDTLVAAFTALLFVATFALWWSTRRLVKGADKNAERQLRAYIFSEETTLSDIEAGKHPSALINVKNSGLTPGTDVTAWAGITVAEFPLKTELTQATEEFMKTASRRTVSPGGTFKLDTKWGQPLADFHLSLMKDGAAAIFIWGEINYLDVFGEKRVCGFRMYYGGDTGMRDDRHPTSDIKGNYYK
jgi:hypothetical protein